LIRLENKKELDELKRMISGSSTFKLMNLFDHTKESQKENWAFLTNFQMSSTNGMEINRNISKIIKNVYGYIEQSKDLIEN